MTLASWRAVTVRLVLLAAVIGATDAAARALAPQAAPGAAPDVTAAGCIAQLDTAGAPPTGHEHGAALGLAITRATVKGSHARGATPSRSAVPGSVPAGSGSGTTRDDAATRAAASTIDQSLWLVGAKSAELARFVGKRVEVAGTIDARLDANPGTPRVTDAGAAAARRAGTAPGEPPVSAHPSAPTRALVVTSFRVLAEACP